MARDGRLGIPGSLLRGILLGGDPGQGGPDHSEGVYGFDSWVVRLGYDPRGAEARLMSLHEAYHGFLNDSTAYGTLLHGVAALHRELDDERFLDLLDALLKPSVDTQETYAVYASLFLVGRGYPDSSLIVPYGEYLNYFQTANLAASRMHNPVLRFQLVQALIRAAMQVDCLPLFTSIRPDEWQGLVGRIEAPDDRFATLMNPRCLSELETRFRAWSALQSDPAIREVLDANEDDDYDALTAERLDPATDAIGYFLYEECRTSLAARGHVCLEFNGHQRHTAGFLATIESFLPTERRGKVLVAAREGSFVEDLVKGFADEQLVIVPNTLRTRGYALDALPEERWEDVAVGSRKHTFIAVRPRHRMIVQYEFDGPVSATDSSADALVAVRRMVVEEGTTTLEHVFVNDPDQLERLIAAAARVGPVVVSCSMSVLAEVEWTNRWWTVIRSASFVSVLMDMNPISQLRIWADSGQFDLAFAVINLTDGARSHIVATLTPVTDEALVFLTPCGPSLSAALTFEVRRLQAAGQRVKEDATIIEREGEMLNLVLSHLLREEPWFDCRGR